MDEIRTPRLLLRPPVTRDAGAIVELAGDWDVARMTGRIPHPYKLADAEDFLGLSIGAYMAEFEGRSSAASARQPRRTAHSTSATGSGNCIGSKASQPKAWEG